MKYGEGKGDGALELVVGLMVVGYGGEREKKQQRPTCLLLKRLNFINQLILLLKYIEHSIYIKTLACSIRIPNSTRTTI